MSMSPVSNPSTDGSLCNALHDPHDDILSMVYDCRESYKSTDSSMQPQFEVIMEQGVACPLPTFQNYWGVLSADYANNLKIILTWPSG